MSDIPKLYHQESVEATKKVLDEALDDGNVRMLMCIWIDGNGYVNVHHSNIPSPSRAIGALEMLKYRLLSED